MWDCIRECERLLKRLKKEIRVLEYKKYCKIAKKIYFKINVSNKGEEREKPFIKQLKVFTESINLASDIIKKMKVYCITEKAIKNMKALEELMPVMEKVYQMTEKREILKEQVPVQEKIFSIYEQHTDIIVKGKREAEFGHKINIGTGKSNLILTCETVDGNPKDSELYQGTLEMVQEKYGIIPGSVVTDGGYASGANLEYAKGIGIINIVFNKIRGSIQNITNSKWVEAKLKRWRSGIEAVISNLKRGFQISRCNWKGLPHYGQKVFWSVIGYNIRVMTGAFMKTLTL